MRSSTNASGHLADRVEWRWKIHYCECPGTSAFSNRRNIRFSWTATISALACAETLATATKIAPRAFEESRKWQRSLLEAGLIVIVATISPFSRDRRLSRELIGIEHFIEVFVDTPLSECERRDPKGLYRKSTLGQDRKLHRDRLDLRNARTAGHNDRYTFRRPPTWR